MADRLAWGILGTGGIAKKFAGQLRDSRQGTLAAVGSRTVVSATEFAGNFGGVPHGSYDAMLADKDVEAVYVSLPNGMHAEWSIRAMRAGKHVLCEKPLAATATEAEQMFVVAEETDRVLVEAFMYRHHPAVMRFIDMARDGAIGEIKLIRSHFTFNRADSPGDVRYQPALAGGSIMDVGCYCVNMIRALAGGQPQRVEAVVHRHATGVDDYASGILSFHGGRVLGSFSCGMTVLADRTTYVGGSDGYMSIDTPWFSNGQFSIVRNGRKETIQVAETANLYALEADAMAAVIRDQVPPQINKDDSLGNMAVLDALRESAGLGY